MAGGNKSWGGERKDELLLAGQVKDWPTPHGMDNRDKERPNGPTGNELGNAVTRTWPTPQSMDGERGAENRETKGARGAGGVNLREACNWSTPKSRDVKGQSQRGQHAPGDALPNMVGLPAPASPSSPGRPRGSLNSRWVAQLMGYPSGWLDLPTETLSWLAATASCRR